MTHLGKSETHSSPSKCVPSVGGALSAQAAANAAVQLSLLSLTFQYWSVVPGGLRAGPSADFDFGVGIARAAGTCGMPGRLALTFCGSAALTRHERCSGGPSACTKDLT